MENRQLQLAKQNVLDTAISQLGMQTSSTGAKIGRLEFYSGRLIIMLVSSTGLSYFHR